MPETPLRGRGSSTNPPNRYEALHVEPDDSIRPGPYRSFYRDTSRSVLAENDSPDVAVPLQPEPVPRLRARMRLLLCASHARVPRLQRRARLRAAHHGEGGRAASCCAPTLASPRWQPELVALSGNTDCYQPVERQLGITRRCLEVFAEFRNPVGVITKSALVARDADLLAELARHGAAHVHVLRHHARRRAGARGWSRARRSPDRRLEAIATLAGAGVPVAVLVGPVIPGLNDAEIPRILAAARRGRRARARPGCCSGCRSRSTSCSSAGSPSTCRSGRSAS